MNLQTVKSWFIKPLVRESAPVAASAQAEARSRGQNDFDFLFGGLSYTESGIPITPQSLISIPAFYRAIRIIAGTLCTMPVEIYSEKGDSVNVDKGHHLNQLLNLRPHPMFTPSVFWETMVLHLQVYSNFYALIRRNSVTQEIVSVAIVENPADVRMEANKRGEWMYYIGKTSNETDEIKYTAYNPDRVIHIKGLSFDGLMGEPQYIVQKENFGVALSLRRYLSKFFGNGAHLSGVLKYPGKLMDAAYQRLKSSWSKTYGAFGTDAGGTAILEEGAEYQPIGQNPQNSQSSETRRGINADISRLTGVPEFLLGESDPTFNNGETMMRHFLVHTILPLCRQITDELNYKLFPAEQRGKKLIRFNFGALLTADSRERAFLIDALMKWGILTINEARKMEGYNPSSDPKTNEHLIPVNMSSEVIAPQDNSQGEPAPGDNKKGNGASKK